MIWPLDSNDLERMDRNWATKEESPPRLVAGGRPGVACDARALKVSRPAGSRKRSNHSVAERGAVPGCVAKSKGARSAQKGKVANVAIDDSQGTDCYPASESLMRVERLVQRTSPSDSKNS
jgi:hypothetical protein